MIKIRLIPAEYGDSILISFLNKKLNIIIDGGTKKTYIKHLKRELDVIRSKNEVIDLMVCTHMDLDHIGGLISIVENNDNNFIKDVWHNGFIQLINSKFYSKADGKYTDDDKKILERIINSDVKIADNKEIGIKEGLSLGALLLERKINVNSISHGSSISVDNIPDKYLFSDDIYVYIVAPSRNKINCVEDSWKKEMVARNFMFNVSDKIFLTKAFEKQMLAIKYFYNKESIKINECGDLEKYIGDLNEEDSSVVNRSSISFILCYKNQKHLFLGDGVTDSELLERLNNIVGYKYKFTSIKLPHHGSRYNISKDFINRYQADEYFCLTNSVKFNHPDTEVLANIICSNPETKTLVFNYPIEKIKMLDNEMWKKKYNYELICANIDEIIEREFE